MRVLPLLVAALVCGAGCDAQISKNLTDAIAKAAKKGAVGEAVSVISHEIDLAPAANLTSGTGDLDPAGVCREDIEIFCPAVKPGYAHLAECLNNQLFDERDGTSEFVTRVSGPCREALTQFKMKLTTNINLDLGMARVCKEDANKLCGYVRNFKFPAKVASCLRAKKKQLSDRCRRRVTRAQIAAAEDYRLDANVYRLCKADAERVCGDVKPGSGLVNACLRTNRAQVSYDCQAELFRADEDGADDVRTSVKLFRACLPEKKRFCKAVAPGAARAKDCLENNRHKAGFGAECKGLLEQMIAARSQDFRLDAGLRDACSGDIKRVCAAEKGASGKLTANQDGKVVRCLQDFREDLESADCRAAVERTLERASEDIRFASNLAQACSQDRETLCKSVPPGSARVIRCLQDSRAQLQPGCKSALFDHEVLMSESIEFKKPLARACVDEVERYCKGIPSGEARVLWCLQQHKDDSEFGDGCKEEVKRYENDMSQDYRLNHRLAQACKSDVSALCLQVCDPSEHVACGGQVLSCLVEHKKDIKKSACKREVFYFIKMEVTDYGNDVALAEACRDDVGKFCAHIDAGKGRVHACLRQHRAQLTAACRSEELKLEVEEAGNVSLKPSVTEACAEERTSFCAGVATGHARVFRCLTQHLGKPDFGAPCRDVILDKLRRRQENWKLDVDLHDACAASADAVCTDVDHGSDKAETLRCMMRRYDELEDDCLSEVARAAHMALFVWQRDAAISGECDADIARICPQVKPAPGVPVAQPGRALECLKHSVRNQHKAAAQKDAADPVGAACKALLDIAEPPDEYAEYEHNLQLVSAASLKRRFADAGMWDHRAGITLTGYTALFCFSAMISTLLLAARYGYQRWRGVDDRGYQRVIKHGDV